MANVLIVDDQEMDRFLESRIVEEAGHCPFFASDGEAALRMYKEHDIAVVITDLQMPIMNGLQLIRDLLEHDFEAVIIAVSGLPEHLKKATDLGAVAGLVKPVSPDTLLESVQDALLNHRATSDDAWGRG